jgi:hypothetical protein
VSLRKSLHVRKGAMGDNNLGCERLKAFAALDSRFRGNGKKCGNDKQGAGISTIILSAFCLVEDEPFDVLAWEVECAEGGCGGASEFVVVLGGTYHGVNGVDSTYFKQVGISFGGFS